MEIRDGKGVTTASEVEVENNSPSIILKNTTLEDGDEGRESEIIFKGTQTGAEVTTLAKIWAAHSGASDDQKGQVKVLVNDGNDGDTPSITAVEIGPGGEIYFAGAVGDTVTSDGAVHFSSTGQIGKDASSERFKTNLRAMTVKESARLYEITPQVGQAKKQDKKGNWLEEVVPGDVPFLIAEEVAKVMPEYALYDTNGLPQGVRYEKLVVPLIAELQKLRSEFNEYRETTTAEIAALKAEIQE